MPPVYQLTPNTEYGKFTIGGIQMADSDFELIGGGFAQSASGKLDEIAQQIGVETGGPAPTIIGPLDRLRAQAIPFRGNPGDVKVLSVAGSGDRIAYSPLGGDFMTPGNEVSAINLSRGNARTIIKVGVRPVRVAVHPAGLIFVCNQYSNYISVIDPAKNQLLVNGTKPVEVKTEFFCGDLTFVPRSIATPDNDKQDLYVANGWRGSVLKYSIDVVRSPLDNRIVDIRRIEPPAMGAESKPSATIPGCGKNPYRLSLSQDLKSIFVANNRGGEIGKLDITTNSCTRTAVKGPIPIVVQANDILVMGTTTLDRGYPSRQEAQANQVPTQILAPPFESTGIDGAKHVTHPGAQFDNTKAMNFEDLRNGLLTMDLQLRSPQYYTDDISAEPNFAAAQKVIAGALPQDIVVNKAGTKAFVALSGSDQIQQFDIVAGQFRLKKGATPVIKTGIRPYALFLDEKANQILVANWGGETLEVFDATSGAAIGAAIDLGYAAAGAAKYPATTIEKGEFLFFNTAWSNNGRKSCASCHFEELLGDGIEYANGATAPDSPHKIPNNWNLATTDSYFWNGSFSNGSYAALASDFQTRSNCELIAFGYIEGISSNPAARVGDPNNKNTLGAPGDQLCRPITVAGQVLAANFSTILQQIGVTKNVRDANIQTATVLAGGLNFAQAARDTDFYSASELRLPPNPLTYLNKNDQLDPATKAKLATGKALFTSAGCANCHNPGDTRHPFTDGLNHGPGANWVQDFITRYSQDPRLLAIIPAIPAQMIAANHPNAVLDRAINVHLDPVDFFVPGCFDINTCLVFEDPLLAARDSQTETDRLVALTTVNLANPDRGYMPGNVKGKPQANTPSIRGIWWQPNYLRHGLARSIGEAILGPGHPALKPGELGFAIDVLGNLDVHGTTSTMSQADFDALVTYVSAIE
ncbi:MAG: cytochrome c peroxidase, partial [Kofleriaceae bacterium]